MSATTDKIWNEFNKELLHFIGKRVKNREVANDLLQDVFVKIHLKLPTLTDHDKLASWVYQITRNTIIDHYRKLKPQGDLSDTADEPQEPETYNSEFSKCLQPFLNGLPDDYREAILQTELGELSQKEFAEKAGISYSGAKSRIQRGREKLLELFNQCCKISADQYGNIMEYQGKNSCSDSAAACDC